MADTQPVTVAVLNEALRRLLALNGDRARTIHKHQLRDVLWQLMDEQHDGLDARPN